MLLLGVGCRKKSKRPMVPPPNKKKSPRPLLQQEQTQMLPENGCIIYSRTLFENARVMVTAAKCNPSLQMLGCALALDSKPPGNLGNGNNQSKQRRVATKHAAR